MRKDAFLPTTRLQLVLDTSSARQGKNVKSPRTTPLYRIRRYSTNHAAYTGI